MIKRFNDMVKENNNNNNKLSVNIEVSNKLINQIKKLGIEDDKTIKKILKVYIDDIIGHPYNSEDEYFLLWSEKNMDNIDDIINEK